MLNRGSIYQKSEKLFGVYFSASGKSAEKVKKHCQQVLRQKWEIIEINENTVTRGHNCVPKIQFVCVLS